MLVIKLIEAGELSLLESCRVKTSNMFLDRRFDCPYKDKLYHLKPFKVCQPTLDERSIYMSTHSLHNSGGRHSDLPWNTREKAERMSVAAHKRLETSYDEVCLLICPHLSCRRP